MSLDQMALGPIPYVRSSFTALVESHMIYALVVAAAGSFLLILVSIYPGVLDDLFFLAMITSCLWLPALTISGVFLLIHLSRGQRKMTKLGNGRPDDFAGVPEPYASHRRSMVVLTLVLLLNIVLFVGGVPRRVAFAISRPAFESQLASPPTTGYQGVALDRRLGIYHVDRLASDPRGGVYFRTHAGADGIGPDTMSYGFAFRPNPVVTPFGRSGYSYSHLFGGWYTFEASNDY